MTYIDHTVKWLPEMGVAPSAFSSHTGIKRAVVCRLLLEPLHWPRSPLSPTHKITETRRSLTTICFAGVEIVEHGVAMRPVVSNGISAEFTQIHDYRVNDLPQHGLINNLKKPGSKLEEDNCQVRLSAYEYPQCVPESAPSMHMRIASNRQATDSHNNRSYPEKASNAAITSQSDTRALHRDSRWHHPYSDSRDAPSSAILGVVKV